MKLLDRIFGWLLVVLVALHCVGTFYFHALLSPIFVQSLSGGIAIAADFGVLGQVSAAFD